MGESQESIRKMPGAFGFGQPAPGFSWAFLIGCIFIARGLNPSVKIR
jgi:hypothetical protein